MTFTQRLTTAAVVSLLGFSIVRVQPAFSQPSSTKTPVAIANALSASAQAQISAVLGRDQQAYQAAAQPGGFRMENPRHRLSGEFTPAGIRLRTGNAEWGLTLRGYGYGDRLLADEVTLQASANRVEYRRGSLSEWYVNGPLGLEQGFNVTQAPGKRHGEPLTFAFNLSGNLTPSVDPGGRGLTLRTAGSVVLSYGGLEAHDSMGRQLRAWMEVAGKRLWLRVDDADAHYPLVVDPLVHQAELTASDGSDHAGFGASVAVSGDTVVVGSERASFAATPAGAYVFVKPTGGWSGALTETASLTSSDSILGTAFGRAVAVDGDTVVVGAFGDLDQAAYVFVKPATGWSGTLTESARLVPSTTGEKAGDQFGISVGVSGDTVVVGSDGFNHLQGAAYVFEKPITGWSGFSVTENAKLTPSDLEGGDFLGRSVGISGDTIVVGAERHNQLRGAAYVFKKPNGGWSGNVIESAKLTASNAAFVLFGLSVGVSGGTVVAGASQDDVGSNVHQGAAYVFEEPAGGWSGSQTESARLTASDGGQSHLFAYQVSVSGDAVLAFSLGANSSQGAAYLFRKPAGGWSGALTETDELAAPDGSVGSGFFGAIAVGGNTIAIGAPNHTIGQNIFQGWAWIFLAPSQVAPVISWAAPAAISYGTALSVTQLNATANVSGTFDYNPPAGTLLNAGTQTLNATFTPADRTAYTTATAQVTLQVNQATPVITWVPASIQLGLPLGAAQLNATATVPGTFAYTPPAGTQVTTTSQTVSAFFTPTDAANYTTATASVSLTVTAGPLASVSPTSIDFGTLYLGSIVTRNVTVRNVGNATLTIFNPFISQIHGGNSNEYVLVNLCPHSLAAGQSCSMTVAFVAGPFYSPQTATLNVLDNAPGSPQTVALTATVINPRATLSASSLSFGNQKVGTASAAKTVTIKNTGATTLAITGIAITGAHPLDFLQTNNCPASLAANASCAISVMFKPTIKNSRSATLRITDNAQSGAQSVALAGVGK